MGTIEEMVNDLYDIVSLIEDGFYEVIRDNRIEHVDLLEVFDTIREAITELEDAYTSLNELKNGYVE